MMYVLSRGLLIQCFCSKMHSTVPICIDFLDTLIRSAMATLAELGSYESSLSWIFISNSSGDKSQSFQTAWTVLLTFVADFIGSLFFQADNGIINSESVQRHN